ncbi:MAG: hypothetical protein ABS939_00240 [Psychrobacillus sp.]
MTKTYMEILIELRNSIKEPLLLLEQLQTVRSFEEVTEILRQAL